MSTQKFMLNRLIFFLAPEFYQCTNTPRPIPTIMSSAQASAYVKNVILRPEIVPALAVYGGSLVAFIISARSSGKGRENWMFISALVFILGNLGNAIATETVYTGSPDLDASAKSKHSFNAFTVIMTSILALALLISKARQGM